MDRMRKSCKSTQLMALLTSTALFSICLDCVIFFFTMNKGNQHPGMPSGHQALGQELDRTALMSMRLA